MTDRKALVQRLLALKAIDDLLVADIKKTRAELAAHFTDPGQREVGKLHDQRLGTVSLVNGAETWAVVDEAAFQDWVIQHYGDRAMIRSVDPIIRQVVLEACKQSGGVLLDEATGEVGLPDGVQQRIAAPTLKANTERHAGWLVWQELEGSLTRLGIEAPR